LIIRNKTKDIWFMIAYNCYDNRLFISF